MAEDIVVAEETGLLGGKLIPIIVIAIVIVGAGAGAYFFMFKDKEEEEDNNGTPIENPDENNTSGGGENITAKFTFTHDEKDHNGEISVKEAVHFDAADSTGGWFFEWDFGDAKFDTSNSSEVTHHYSQAGTYTVVVNVSTNTEWDEYSEAITISEEEYPEATLMAAPDPVNPDSFYNTTGVNWAFAASGVSGNAEQMDISNMILTLNKSDNETPYFSEEITQLLTPPEGQAFYNTPWDTGIYFKDLPIAINLLSDGDTFYIVDDGGEGAEEGDILSLYFSPEPDVMVFLDSIILQAPATTA